MKSLAGGIKQYLELRIGIYRRGEIFMKIENLFYESANQVNKIAGYIYYPEGDVQGIIQISHGMCEYVNNYKDYIDFLTKNGYLVCGNDHLGHGASAKKDAYGFISEKDGYLHLVDDVHQLTVIVKEKYPKVPYILLGHSMGSFIARLYAFKYGKEIDGLILSGTAGKNPLAKIGKIVAKHYIRKDGGTVPSAKLTHISFGNYNKKYKDAKTPMDWLSRDEEIPQNYLKDPQRNFLFTSSAFLDLITLIDLVNSDGWFSKFPKKLPVYLIAGDMDPVGNYGKGIKQVYYKLIEHRVDHIQMKLYKDARHEILFELNKEEVYEDTLIWIDELVGVLKSK